MKHLGYIFLALLIFASLQYSYAQGPPPPPPDGGGGDGTVTDVVPINSLVYPFMLLGVYLGYRFVKKSSE